MRPNQHQNNKRSRGRSRRPGGGTGSGSGGGGGGGNPINRVYESNGPDIKVRGTAQTVADKYLQLARDAHSSGDTVNSESYYQHAEHYLRIVAAAQAYQQQMQPQYRQDDDGDDGDDDGMDGDGDDMGSSAQDRRDEPQQPQRREAEPAEQPDVSGFEPPERQGGYAPQPRDSRPRGEGQGRERFRPRFDRPREPRDGQPQGEARPPRFVSDPQPEMRPPRVASEAPAYEPPVMAAPQPEPNGNAWSEDEQPSFLRRPASAAPARRPGRPRRERAEETAAPQPAGEEPAAE